MYTNSVGVPINYNALLTEPDSEFSVTTDLAPQALGLVVAPNPVRQRVTVSMEIPTKDRLRIALYDMKGREVAELFDDRSKKTGTLEYSFDLGPLDAGMYLFTAILGNQEIATRKIVKE